jgi:hypothetical protein
MTTKSTTEFYRHFGDLPEGIWHWLRIPRYPVSCSDNIRSVIPGYPVT